MRRLLALLLIASSALAGLPTSTNNDDTCDIAVMPAATLLLPYFEVDISGNATETTLVTITNTGHLPQVARITLWTDWAYPVIVLNVFLTGYDVQSINLFDVIALGRLAPDDGTGFDTSPVGYLSGITHLQIPHDNPLLIEESCVDLPVQLPRPFITRMQSTFTTGRAPSTGFDPLCNTAGSSHANVVGYATIDVVSWCGTSLPTNPAYFAEELRFDNVLIGDYVQLSNRSRLSAQGNPLVHIRAIPEGGTQQTRVGPAFDVNFRRTFYSRYQGGRTADARQPLPSLFAARWISETGVYGSEGRYGTAFKIWREGHTTASTVCSAYPVAGAALTFAEAVRFDEEENPETFGYSIIPGYPPPPILPSTSRVDATDTT